MIFTGSSDVMSKARSSRPAPGSLLHHARDVLRATSDKVDAFFFAPDTTRWELVRIGAAIVVLGTLLLTGFSGNYERLYGHWGSLPRTEALDVIHWPGFLFLLNSDPFWIWRIYGITCVMALFLAVGFWTRVAAVATWFLFILQPFSAISSRSMVRPEFWRSSCWGLPLRLRRKASQLITSC
jgi:hypothetical protein